MFGRLEIIILIHHPRSSNWSRSWPDGIIRRNPLLGSEDGKFHKPWRGSERAGKTTPGTNGCGSCTWQTIPRVKCPTAFLSSTTKVHEYLYKFR